MQGYRFPGSNSGIVIEFLREDQQSNILGSKDSAQANQIQPNQPQSDQVQRQPISNNQDPNAQNQAFSNANTVPNNSSVPTNQGWNTIISL